MIHMDTYYVEKEPDTCWLLTKTTAGINKPVGVVKDVQRAVALIRYEYKHSVYENSAEIAVTRHQEIKDVTTVYLPEQRMKTSGYYKNKEWYNIQVNNVGLAGGETYTLTKVPTL